MTISVFLLDITAVGEAGTTSQVLARTPALRPGVAILTEAAVHAAGLRREAR